MHSMVSIALFLAYLDKLSSFSLTSLVTLLASPSHIPVSIESCARSLSNPALAGCR